MTAPKAPSNEQLVAAAYDEAKQQVIQNLEGRVRQIDRWMEGADDELTAFWSRMRERGIPDRPAERDAYQRLADQIRFLDVASETP